MLPKSQAKFQIQELVKKYENVVSSHLISKYTEEETKKGFIEPLFEILGWNIKVRNEVTLEEHQSSGRVDYGFYLNDRLKFYLEAKALSVDLNREDFANQAVRYSWNKGATWAVLTDFESIKVFNAQNIDSSLADKLFFEIKYTEYLDRFDQLWLLSKESFEEDLLDKEAEKYGKKLQTVSVTSLLYKDLEKCREILTHDLSQWNPKVDNDLIDEGVQKLLDRLIFLRVAEDRGIEPQILEPLIREWKSGGRKGLLYQSMVKKFRELDEVYNSNLFSEHPFEKWEEYDNATEKVINILYGKKGYYEYDFQAMPADILGSIYENYLGYKLNKSKKGLTVSKDAKKRKEHGIYYTPTFIVDYIVKNTLKPVLDKCKSINDLKKIKVLDPACGSGSFLIKALEVIYDKYQEFGSSGGVYTKINILLENIYGVDLDPQAVEIARLNLLISALDTRMKLPGLDKNIRNGNSLISGSDEELKKYFGNNFRDKKPFNWQEEFPEVSKQGGFDVIIGNPPYVNSRNLDPLDKKYLESSYQTARNQYDLYVLFIEKSLNILNEKGRLGFIVPNKFLITKYGETLKEFINKNAFLEKSLDLSKENVFRDASVYPVIVIFQKGITKNKQDISTMEKFVTAEKDPIVAKIDSKPNFVSLRVWRPFATSKEIIPGEKVVITNREIQRYAFLASKKGDSKISKAVDSTQNKIIMKKLCFNLEACLDTKGYLAVNTTYCIQPIESDVDIKFVLGILNSKLMSFYARREYLNTALRGGYIELRVYQVKILPIVRIPLKDQQLIIGLVNKIIKLNDDFHKIPVNSEKWNSIKSEIQKTDKKIDEEVYKLYNLTPEEIKIIEGKNVTL